MYIEYVKNRNSPGCFLLRESYRVNGKVRKRTVANLTQWPRPIIDGLRALLHGGRIAGEDDQFTVTRTLPHGHVAAVMQMIRQVGLDKMISAKPAPELDAALAMIAARITEPRSKLATARSIEKETATCTLAEQLPGLEESDVESLYAAMDWLGVRQEKIENKLAKKHLTQDAIALYDLTSTWYEGKSCPLAAYGHPRDGKKGKLQVNFGLICDSQGRPIAVDVFKGNTADPTTVATQIRKFKERFGLEHVILIGDRGMLTQTQITQLLAPESRWLHWISALRAPAIKKLAQQGMIQPTLFDETDLAEIRSPDFPDERLVVCRNPFLAEERARKRQELLAATEARLDRIVEAVRRRKRPLKGKDQIGLRVGKVINQYKMAKHFTIVIADNAFEYRRNDDAIAAEAALDGIYVIRTNVPKNLMTAEETVEAYKSLSRAERAFRSMKTIDLKVRPIYHHLEDRVKAHIFLCMLAYYVEWHMRRKLAPILFDDDDPEAAAAARTSIVAPAQRSPKAQAKAAAKRTVDDFPVHSFRTLMDDLATICLNTIQPAVKSAPTFTKITTPTPLQQRALDLLGVTIRSQ